MEVEIITREPPGKVENEKRTKRQKKQRLEIYIQCVTLHGCWNDWNSSCDVIYHDTRSHEVDTHDSGNNARNGERNACR